VGADAPGQRSPISERGRSRVKPSCGFFLSCSQAIPNHRCRRRRSVRRGGASSLGSTGWIQGASVLRSTRRRSQHRPRSPGWTGSCRGWTRSCGGCRSPSRGSSPTSTERPRPSATPAPSSRCPPTPRRLGGGSVGGRGIKRLRWGEGGRRHPFPPPSLSSISSIYLSTSTAVPPSSLIAVVKLLPGQMNR